MLLQRIFERSNERDPSSHHSSIGMYVPQPLKSCHRWFASFHDEAMHSNTMQTLSSVFTCSSKTDSDTRHRPPSTVKPMYLVALVSSIFFFHSSLRFSRRNFHTYVEIGIFFFLAFLKMMSYTPSSTLTSRLSILFMFLSNGSIPRFSRCLMTVAR